MGDRDRHVTIYKPTPKKPYPVLDEYGYADLAVVGGMAVISNTDNRSNITKAEVYNLVTGVSRGIAFTSGVN